MDPLVFERELPITEFQTLRTWPLEFWLFNLEALFYRNDLQEVYDTT